MKPRSVSWECFYELHPSCHQAMCECYCHRPEDSRGLTFDRNDGPT